MPGIAWFLVGFVAGFFANIATEIVWSWIEYWRTPRWRR